MFDLIADLGGLDLVGLGHHPAQGGHRQGQRDQQQHARGDRDVVQLHPSEEARQERRDRAEGGAGHLHERHHPPQPAPGDDQLDGTEHHDVGRGDHEPEHDPRHHGRVGVRGQSEAQEAQAADGEEHQLQAEPPQPGEHRSDRGRAQERAHRGRSEEGPVQGSRHPEVVLREQHHDGAQRGEGGVERQVEQQDRAEGASPEDEDEPLAQVGQGRGPPTTGGPVDIVPGGATHRQGQPEQDQCPENVGAGVGRDGHERHDREQEPGERPTREVLGDGSPALDAPVGPVDGPGRGEVRHERPAGQVVEHLAGHDGEHDRVQHPDGGVPGGDENGQDDECDRSGQVGADHQPHPVDPVDDHPGRQSEQQEGHEAGDEQPGHQERVVGEQCRDQWQGDGHHAVAEVTGQAPEPEAVEVPAETGFARGLLQGVTFRRGWPFGGGGGRAADFILPGRPPVLKPRSRIVPLPRAIPCGVRDGGWTGHRTRCPPGRP